MIFRDYKKPVNNHRSITIHVTGNIQNPDYKEFRHPDEIDGCPNGDYSGSNNDGKCGEAPEEVTEEEESPVEESGSGSVDEDDISTDEGLEEFLASIFEEFGIQNVESGEGFEVNNTFSLSQTDKDKIDTIIKKWISEKGESFGEKLQNAIPQLKIKYADTRYHVILDYISESVDKLIHVKVIHSVQDISNGNIGGLEFQISQNLQGKISNVGVEFTNESGIRERQELKIQSDGKYMVAFSKDSCSGCKDLRPYYLLSGRTDVIIASTQNSDIEISASSYDIFKQILTNIWFWKGYDKEYNRVEQKILDIKEDIRGEIINVILQEIANEASGGVDMGLINIDTLPVAGYMLNKFLNGPVYEGEKTSYVTDKEGKIVKSVYFDNGHWISKRFRESVDYNNILDLISQNGCNHVDYDGYLDIKDGEEVVCVLKDGSGFDFFQELDLYMATHAYYFSVSIFKEDGSFYTRIKFWDEYDFEPNKYGYTHSSGKTFAEVVKTNLSNNLNYLGNYYEKKLSGNTYWWEVEIINKYD